MDIARTSACQRTQRNHQDPDVTQPVGGFTGQLRDKEPQDGPQVALPSHCHHLHWLGHGGVTVTATESKAREQRRALRINTVTFRQKSSVVVDTQRRTLLN